MLRTLCDDVSVSVVNDSYHRDQQLLSSQNCSHFVSVSGERAAVLALRCHGDDDVIRVTSLCAGYLRRSGDCHGCCIDELNDCRVAVQQGDYSLMSLTASCDGRQSCLVQIYQPSVNHRCPRRDATSDYVVVIYRCSPPITAGLYASANRHCAEKKLYTQSVKVCAGK